MSRYKVYYKKRGTKTEKGHRFVNANNGKEAMAMLRSDFKWRYPKESFTPTRAIKQ